MASEMEDAFEGAGRFIDFTCPYCKEALSYREEYAGLAQECVNCMEAVIVPRDATQAGRKLPIPLQTPRLLLRRLHPDDWKDVLEIAGDEEVSRYLGDLPVADEEQITRWLRDDAKERLTQPGQALCLGLVLSAGEKLIGHLSLQLIDVDHRQASFSVCLNRAFHRKGLATEAVRAMLAFCFAGIGLHRVATSCDSRNEAACRLLQRAGFRREGEFIQNSFVNGEWVDTVYYAMLSTEYSSTKNGAGPGTSA